MLSWLRKSSPNNFLTVDIHSHLLPGLDDGVKTMEESLSILRGLSKLGFKKVITTPHIIADYYPNTPQIISDQLGALKEALIADQLKLTVEAAAEYYLDEHFMNQIDQSADMLTFGDNYLLMETGFMNKPVFLNEAIFKLISRGYKPILAHPERYQYLQEDFQSAVDLKLKGVLFQINALSLNGYYSKEAKKLAAFLIDNGLVDFIGSDIHNMNQYRSYTDVIHHKLYRQCRQLPLRNNALLD